MQRRLDRAGLEQLALADRAHFHLAVEAAPVEPRAVEALARLRAGVAPVDPHDDRVRARGELRAQLERQVGAAVGAQRAAVHPDVGAEVRRLEAERVGARRGGLEASCGTTPPSLRSCAAPGAPGEWRRVQHVRAPSPWLPREAAALPAEREAAVGGVFAQRPAASAACARPGPPRISGGAGGASAAAPWRPARRAGEQQRAAGSVWLMRARSWRSAAREPPDRWRLCACIRSTTAAARSERRRQRAARPAAGEQPLQQRAARRPWTAAR